MDSKSLLGLMVECGLWSKSGVDICSAFTGSQGPGKREWARAAGTMGPECGRGQVRR